MNFRCLLPLQKQFITICLIPLKPQLLIQPVCRQPCGIGCQLYMMHIHLLCRLNHSRHQLLSVSTATARRADNHRFNISNGELQRMFDAKRSGSHDVPFIPNHIHMNICIAQGIVQSSSLQKLVADNSCIRASRSAKSWDEYELNSSTVTFQPLYIAPVLSPTGTRLSVYLSYSAHTPVAPDSFPSQALNRIPQLVPS